MIQTLNTKPYYVPGGTLVPNSPCYVKRGADFDLYNNIRAGHFCYILSSRQIGKSSLMARTSFDLEKEGYVSIIIDLTQIGTDISHGQEKANADSWYYGFATQIARKIDRTLKVDEWWEKQKKLPSLQKLMIFFEDIVLSSTNRNIVIFIDEIDTTINMPFKDDFFAAIRSCYNKRANNPSFERFTFVLIGVASPSDLIKDPKRTPFNIGIRIELNDFTKEEAMQLSEGLSTKSNQTSVLMDRILFWTNGHPYLTQKLCDAILNKTNTTLDQSGVDKVVHDLFFCNLSKQQDHIEYVNERLKDDFSKNKKLIKIYSDIINNRNIIETPASAEQTILKLSGIVKADNTGKLYIRNRIYHNYFNNDWLKEITPESINIGSAIIPFAYLWLLIIFPIYRINLSLLSVGIIAFLFPSILLVIYNYNWLKMEKMLGPVFSTIIVMTTVAFYLDFASLGLNIWEFSAKYTHGSSIKLFGESPERILFTCGSVLICLLLYLYFYRLYHKQNQSYSTPTIVIGIGILGLLLLSIIGVFAFYKLNAQYYYILFFFPIIPVAFYIIRKARIDISWISLLLMTIFFNLEMFFVEYKLIHEGKMIYSLSKIIGLKIFNIPVEEFLFYYWIFPVSFVVLFHIVKLKPYIVLKGSSKLRDEI